MLHDVKKAIQDKIYNRCYNSYGKEVAWQSERYAAFLQQRGEQAVLAECRLPAMRSSHAGTKEDTQKAAEPACMQILQGENCRIFAAEDGLTETEAALAFHDFMEQNPSCRAAYAQEDYVAADGRRHHPWFKPVFSPDTLADSFYIGNIFAIREEFCPPDTGTRIERGMAAELFLKTVRDSLSQGVGLPQAAGLVDAILFHRFGENTDNCDGAPERLPEHNILADWLERAGPAQESFAMEVYHMGIGTALNNRKLVSVIIPSKDNPDVLYTCLRSVRERTEGIGYEIIVVDNGSTAANRERIEQMAGEEDFSYLYQEMDFNFSAMCNLGAEQARCDCLLFLNDDMEIIQQDWMLKLYEKAVLAHAGAVGAKLLYPDSDLIQHAGVTNLQAGPAHKLLKEHDDIPYYHGKNRGVHDMLAVTAACLMVSRDKFYEAGGFYEGIAVSYNDVDFCFTLYEKGYYNIQRNDVTLYHHESLSRGDDNLSEEKWKRLLQEKDILYRRHPRLKGFDPFYSIHLAGYFSDYLCGFAYPYERRDCYTGLSAYSGREPLKWCNNCLTLTVEHAGRERRLDLAEENEALWIEGWSYVLGMDNCRYRREILLFGDNGRNYRAKVLTRYRKDVEEILPEQTHVALSGFTCRIPGEKLDAGNYRIAMLAKDCCSGQRLYRTSDTVLVVENKNI